MTPASSLRPSTTCIAPTVRRRALRVCALGALSLALVGLPGCALTTGNATTSQVRIIDASPDAPGVDLYQGNSVLAYNLGLGTITSYIPTSPGIYTVAADKAGSRQQLASARATYLANTQYTILIGDLSAALQTTVLTDQSVPAPSGDVSLRFIAQATRSGAVDVYLIPTGSTILQTHPALTNVVFGTNTGYLNVPAGTYTLAAMPAGTVPTSLTLTTYTGTAVVYPGGSARTIILIDQQLVVTPGLQVIIADDYDSPNAQS